MPRTRHFGSAALMVALLVVQPLVAALITEVAGADIVIDLGRHAGVTVGMTGTVSLETSAGGALTTVTIANFEVVAVDTTSCRARLLEVGEGWKVEAGQRVAFDLPLVPPRATPRPSKAVLTVVSPLAGVVVAIDGRELGPAPQTTELTPGSHRTVVQAPGYDPTEQLVELASGEQRELELSPRLPSDPVRLATLGGEAFASGRWNEAIAAYEALLQIIPGDPVGELRLGEAREAQEAEARRAAEARRRAEEEERRQAEVAARLANADYLLLQGDAMMEAGNWELAAQYYRKIAEVEPAFKESGAKLALAELQQALSAAQFEEAQAQLAELQEMQLSPELEARVGKLATKMVTPGSRWQDPVAGMPFRYIPPGSFLMGSSSDEAGRGFDETQHEVVLSRGFWMGETEVTQGQWEAITGTNPSLFPECGADCPVENISWLDALSFANSLSDKAGLKPCYDLSGTEVRFVGAECPGFRLPTEAEWEYAARAGEDFLYAGSDDLQSVGWYAGNSGRKSHRVAVKAPNAWGLQDMSGNVWEWVWDWKADYPEGPVTDPAGPATGSYRVRRGGGWNHKAPYCRVADRYGTDPAKKIGGLGLRIVRTAK